MPVFFRKVDAVVFTLRRHVQAGSGDYTVR